MRRLLLVLPILLFVALLLLLSRDDPASSPPAAAPEPGRPAAPPPPPSLRGATPSAPETVMGEEKPGQPAAISLLPKGTVAGRALLEGEPSSEGIVIRIARYEDPGDDPDLPNWFETVTGPDGSFRLDDLPPGRYGLAARPPGRDFALKRFDFVVPENCGHGPVELVWPACGSIWVELGVLRDAPRKGEQVRLDRHYGSSVLSGFRYEKTDDQGCVVFRSLEPGEYSVDWNGRSLPVSVEGGKETRVVFRGTCSFRGTLTGPDGKPLVNAIVRLGLRTKKGEKYRSVQCRSKDDGIFSVENAAPGDYSLGVQVLGKGGWATHVGRVTLRDGDAVTRDIRVPDTTISGRVTRAGSGDSVLAGEVQITANAVEGNASSMAFCDDHGRYAFVGLPPGRYAIWIAPLRIPVMQVRREVTLPETGRLEGVDFALEPR